ncbi:H-type lectin domain-containing protein [Loktanella sp. DSM 29012]|uniref:H-type lectin domain-containing protein n=1 Tax=Loktanella sp. DSM 29012 TaxID=1881056 RepID=UPI000AAB6CF7|nr:H-type lectin domain-containing protein [Loktanella sp. DSM 29012]
MRRIENNAVGIDQGDLVLFSDFEDDGAMWTGEGPRVTRQRVNFGELYADTPLVHVSLSMWDISNSANSRVDITSENIARDGFDVVFRTWGDTQVARVRVAWMAIGTLRSEDAWDI